MCLQAGRLAARWQQNLQGHHLIEGILDLHLLETIEMNMWSPLSTSEQAMLAFLELIDEGIDPPDGLDVEQLAEAGLVSGRSGGWALTDAGLLRLANLRSVALAQTRVTW